MALTAPPGGAILTRQIEQMLKLEVFMTELTVETLLEQLTLEEKAALCVGATPWQTVAVERLGLPHITVSDGPHGVRRAIDPTALINESFPATCFPVAAALAATWDTALMHELGVALAEECIALDTDILLGPGINMKRSPPLWSQL